MSSSQLSAGSVAAIKRSILPSGTKPLMQVLSVTPFLVQSSERFKLEVSDGQNFTAAMLATQHNELIKTNKLKPNTILRIREYITNEIQQKQIVILLDVEVVEQCNVRIGAPVEFDGSNNSSNAQGNRVVAPPAPLQQQQQFQQPPPQQFQQPPQQQYQQPPPQQFQQPPQQQYQQQYQQQQQRAPMAAAVPPPQQPQYQQQYTPPQFKQQAGPVATMSAQRPQQAFMQQNGAMQQVRTTPIKNLNPYQNKWTIKARVTSKTDVRSWDKGPTNQGKLFSADLVDSEGTEIRATFFKEAVDSFYELLQPGGVYLLSEGRIKVANKQFSAIKNEYEISFDKNSHIIQVPDEGGIAKIHVNPVEIANLAHMESKSTTDIVGIVIDAGGEVQQFQSKAGKELRKLEVEVVDQSKTSIRVALWGAKADEVFAQLQVAGPNPVIAFKSLSVGEFGGGKTLSSISSTLAMVNPVELPQTGPLRMWFDAGNGRSGVSALSAAKFGSGAGSGGGMDADGNRAPVPIEDRISFEAIENFALGRSGQADYGELKAYLMFVKKDGLFYAACRTEKCGKKLTQNPGNGRWECEKCNQSFDSPDYRYIANFNVVDSTGHAWCTAFGPVGEKIFGCSANELKQWEDADKNQFNQIVEHAQFTEAVFRVKVKEETYNSQTRVKTAIVGFRPIDYVHESRKLLRGIAMLQQRRV